MRHKHWSKRNKPKFRVKKSLLSKLPSVELYEVKAIGFTEGVLRTEFLNVAFPYSEAKELAAALEAVNGGIRVYGLVRSTFLFSPN